MKPKSKAEARWKYWREENPKKHQDRFSTWAKKMMKRAQRRWFKKIQDD
jgi:hypothetical protein